MSMLFENTDVIERPVSEVYDLVKNHLPKIAPFMPNIEKIENLSQESAGANKTKHVNIWYAKAEIPAVAKKFIQQEFLAWKDYALWDDKKHQVTYELESSWGNKLYDATGCNTFKAQGKNATLFTISCQVEIHPEQVPGVPKFLVKRVLPHIEKLIQKIIGPNMASLGQGIKKYYQESSGKSGKG